MCQTMAGIYKGVGLTPSNSDEELTRKIKAAGYFLDLKVIDHLIVTIDGYYLFAEAGFL